MIERRFNLIDERWIPVADKGLVSLYDIFTDTMIKALGGNPLQKISILKLLLAIAQSAWTPVDEKEWREVGAEGMSKIVLGYFDKWYDEFWLYGEKPFLQMPEIEKAEKKSFGCVIPHVSFGNTTVLTESQIEQNISDDQKALILIQQMGFAFSGKKTDNKIILTPGYTGKLNEKGRPATGRAGPSLAFQGLLHSFVLGSRLLDTLWYNVFTENELEKLGIFSEGLGKAPWELMPKGEDDKNAQILRNSYIGRLVPLSRFILLTDDGLHYSEGIAHLNYQDGIFDPSTAIDLSSSKHRALWVDPEKKPWRQLPALLSFMGENTNGFNCAQLKIAIKRIKDIDSFIVWAGGIRVSSNAGEQYLSGTDDFVESEVQISGGIFGKESEFFLSLSRSMERLDDLSRFLWGRVNAYCKDQKVDGKGIANQATGLFWQLCEREFQKLVDACDPNDSGERLKKLHDLFLSYAYKAYDFYCPNDTARQMEAWAANRLRYTGKKKNGKEEGAE